MPSNNNKHHNLLKLTHTTVNNRSVYYCCCESFVFQSQKRTQTCVKNDKERTHKVSLHYNKLMTINSTINPFNQKTGVPEHNHHPLP